MELVVRWIPAQQGSDPDMRLRRRCLTAFTTLVAVGLSACGSGLTGTAETGKTLVLSLNQTEAHPSYVALTAFGERLNEATDGRWDVRVYPNETLGAQQEVIQLVSDGSVDMAVASGTQLENLNIEFAVLNLPTTFHSIEHQMQTITDETVVGDLFGSLEDEKHLTVLGGLTQGERNLYTVEGPIETPADLAGQKVRVQESDIAIDMINAMGASATPMSFGEVYTALQSGVLDGAENNEVSYVTQNHNEVAKHVAFTRHLVGLDYMLINTDVYQGMSEADRTIFDDEWAATMAHHTQLWVEETAAAIESAEEGGSTFNEVDQVAFREALAPVVGKYLTSDEDRALFEKIQRKAEQ